MSWSTFLRDEPHHNQHTGLRSHSTPGYGRSLIAFVLQGIFQDDVRFQRDPQTADFRQRMHFRHVRSPRY